MTGLEPDIFGVNRKCLFYLFLLTCLDLFGLEQAVIFDGGQRGGTGVADGVCYICYNPYIEEWLGLAGGRVTGLLPPLLSYSTEL